MSPVLDLNCGGQKLKILKFTESTETMLLVSVVHKISALDLKCGHRNWNNECIQECILYTEKTNNENTENLF